MKSSLPAATKAEKARFEKLFNFGCAACHVRMLGWQAPEMHHLLSGGRRRGHAFTVPLCPWHHRGYAGEHGVHAMTQIFGPSMAREPKKFRAEFGTDDELLEAANFAMETT